MSLNIFAYGSLIWRPGFKYESVRKGRVSGYERRFWQASHDHRGTPADPGRVLTLVPIEGGHCEGMIYQMPFEDRHETLAALDEREQDGYERVWLKALCVGEQQSVSVLTWVASVHNPSWVGDEPEHHTASVIASSHGESGSNIEYLTGLYRALIELEIEDAYITKLAKRVGGKNRND